jgi:hypothetical protein
MHRVSIGRRFVGKGHQPNKGISLPARRYVRADMNVDQPKDVVAKGGNVVSRARFVGLGSLWLPAKSEDMNKHD